jgi:hypothetical protein
MKLKPALLAAFTLTSVIAFAAPPDVWLHVKVDNTEGKQEHVRVNVPLSLAEKVLPAIQVNKMHNGRVQFGRDKNVSIDPHTLVEAVRNTADGVFVTVESNDEEVRVAKEGGYLLVRVRPGRKPSSDHKQESVDVKLPMDVVEALLSGGRDEIDILAGIRALAKHQDSTLVSVTDNKQTVRIWVDSKNSAD